MDPTIVMRSFHTMIRSQMIDETKNGSLTEEQRDKLLGMNYISGLSLDTQTVNIPSNFLMPKLQPRDLVELKEPEEKDDKCS